MTNYYAVLSGQQERPTRIGKFPEIPDVPNMISGEAIAIEIPKPLEFYLDPELPGDRQHFYRPRIPVMSNRLIDLLIKCGIDNLQLFPAVIINSATNNRWEDYQAVNIVGAIACVDFARSEHTNDVRLIRAEFDGFMIDPVKAGNYKFFRLAEAVGTIIAREDVRDYLMREEPNALEFIPTEDYGT